nr:MAG TPA: hypothetical protein [Caudoviricetes sp.]
MVALHFIPTAVIAAQFTAVLPLPFIAEIVAIIARIIFILFHLFTSAFPDLEGIFAKCCKNLFCVSFGSCLQASSSLMQIIVIAATLPVIDAQLRIIHKAMFIIFNIHLFTTFQQSNISQWL